MYRLLLPLLIAVVSFFSASSAENISGAWSGILKLSPQMQLKLVFNFSEGESDTPEVYIDSPDQGAFGIPGNVEYISADSVSVSVPRIGASFSGAVKDNKLSGTFRQSMMSFLLELSAGGITYNRPQTPLPPFNYTSKDITFSNPAANAVLAGTLTLPVDINEQTPVVVLVTGSGLQNRDEEIFGHRPFAVLADFLANHGIASLRYDDRGCASSTGDSASATTLDFAQDAKCAVEYLRNNENFKNIGVLGHSEGASIAFILADPNEKDLFADPAFIIAMGAPAVRGDSILVDQTGRALRMSGIGETAVTDYGEVLSKIYSLRGEGKNVNEAEVDSLCASWPAGPVYDALKKSIKEVAASDNAWINFFASYSPAANISAVKCPAFVLYGEKDIQVSPALNMPAIRSLAPDAVMKLYPSLNHLFQHAVTGSVAEYSTIEETISPEVLEDISSFIGTCR